MSHTGIVYRVFLKGLECYAFHGVPAEERVVGHRYTTDIELLVDGDAVEDDEIRHTTDYSEVGKVVRHLVETTQHRTLERLVFTACSQILERFPKVTEARVRISKPLPPMPLIAESAGVEVTLKRQA